MLTKMISDRDYRPLFLICLAVLLVAGYGYYVIVCRDTPTAQIQATDQVIDQAKDDNAATLRRLDTIEDKLQKEVRAVRLRERAYVDNLPADDVAAGIVSELRLFLDGQPDE